MNGHNHIEYKISFWKFLKTKTHILMQASDFFACTFSLPTLPVIVCKILYCHSKLSWSFQSNDHNHIEYKILFLKFLKTKILMNMNLKVWTVTITGKQQNRLVPG